MNKAYDYNGVVVSKSNPIHELRTVTKSLLIDSADRDITKYYTNGDVVYYLPRVYENVVCIRLKSATFTPVVIQESSPPNQAISPIVHSYINGNNTPSALWSSDASAPSTTTYFLLDIEGLNKCDETAIGADRSTLVDSYFARIPCEGTTNSSSLGMLNYNDHTLEENIGTYSPPIGKLDRLHIVTRLHSQQGSNKGFIYWTSNGSTATNENRAGGNYSLVLELTMLDNSFDNFSSFESRLSTRMDAGHFGC